MSKSLVKALVWGGLIALWLAVGLEPTGWLFYEASHGLGVDSLYWGYTIFRGAAYGLGLVSWSWLVSLGGGLLVGLLVYWRTSRKSGVAQ